MDKDLKRFIKYHGPCFECRGRSSNCSEKKIGIRIIHMIATLLVISLH